MAPRRLALSLAGLVLALPSFAQTHTWTGNGTAGDISVWNQASNWDGIGVPPVNSTATVIFGPSNRYEVSLGGARSVGALSFTGIGAYTVYDGDLTLTTGSLTSDGQGNHYFAGNIALGANGVFAINNGGGNWPFRMVGVISDSGGARSLTKTGYGTLELWGANTYSGSTIVDRGTLALGHDAALSSGTVLIGNGATLTAIGGPRTIANTVNVTTGAVFDIGSSSLTINGGLTGVGPIYKRGAGTLTLNGTANRTSGDFVLEAGTLAIGNSNAIASAHLGGTSAKLLATGGTLTAVGADRTLFGDFVIDGTLEVNLGQYSLATEAVVMGRGTLLKTGTGTFGLLQNHNLFSGETVIREGKLAIRYGATSENAWGGIGRGLITLAGGTLGHADQTSVTALNNPFRLAGDSAFEFLSPVTLNGVFTLAGNHTLAIDGTVVFGGGITEENGAHAFIKNGPGTALLTGANTFTGGLIVNAGTVQLGDNGNHLAPASRVTVNGGTFRLGAADQTLTSLNGNGGTIDLFNGTGRTLTLAGDDTAAISSAIVGTGAQLVKSGSGTLTLGGISTYSGGTTLNSGTLLVASNSALGTGTVTLNGGRLGATGGAHTLANAVVLNNHTTFTGDSRLTLAGTFTLARTFELAVDAGSTLAISGPIAQSGGTRTLQKFGAGTLELTGANTYTGGTLIADGTVRINNTTGSAFGTGAVTIDTAGTLTGAGVFSGALQNNGTYAPGNSPALASLSSFSQGPTGILEMEIAGLDRGTGYDALDVAGALAFGGTLEVVTYGAFTPASFSAGQSFDLFNWGSATGTFSTLNLPDLSAYGLTWDTSALYSTGVLSVTTSAVPEPSTYAAFAGLAALGLVALRRRRATP